jgi:hypothetical protein
MTFKKHLTATMGIVVKTTASGIAVLAIAGTTMTAVPTSAYAGFTWKGEATAPQAQTSEIISSKKSSQEDAQSEVFGLEPVIQWNKEDKAVHTDTSSMPAEKVPQVSAAPLSPAEKIVLVPPVKATAPVPTDDFFAADSLSGDVLSGFGSDVPLVMAMQQIAPLGYQFSFAAGVNAGTPVSWEGGKPWKQVLVETLSAKGLGFREKNNVIVVGHFQSSPVSGITPRKTPMPLASTTPTPLASTDLMPLASASSLPLASTAPLPLASIPPTPAARIEDTIPEEPAIIASSVPAAEVKTVTIRREKPTSLLKNLSLNNKEATAQPEKKNSLDTIKEPVAVKEPVIVKESALKKEEPVVTKPSAPIKLLGSMSNASPLPVLESEFESAPATATIAPTAKNISYPPEHRSAVLRAQTAMPLLENTLTPKIETNPPLKSIAPATVTVPAPAVSAPAVIAVPVVPAAKPVPLASSVPVAKTSVPLTPPVAVAPPLPVAAPVIASVTPPAAAPAALSTQPTLAAPSWHAGKGQTLRAALEDWSKVAGVELYWSIDYDYRLNDDIAYAGTYDEAVAKLLDLFTKVRPQPYGQLHQGSEGSARVLVVSSYDLKH